MKPQVDSHSIECAQQFNVRMKQLKSILAYAVEYGIYYRDPEITKAFLDAFGSQFKYSIQNCYHNTAIPTLDQLIMQVTQECAQRDTGVFIFATPKASNLASVAPSVPITGTAAAALTTTTPPPKVSKPWDDYCFAHGINKTHSPWKEMLDPVNNAHHRCKKESECPGFDRSATMQDKKGGKPGKWKFNDTLGP